MLDATHDARPSDDRRESFRAPDDPVAAVLRAGADDRPGAIRRPTSPGCAPHTSPRSTLRSASSISPARSGAASSPRIPNSHRTTSPRPRSPRRARAQDGARAAMSPLERAAALEIADRYPGWMMGACHDAALRAAGATFAATPVRGGPIAHEGNAP